VKANILSSIDFDVSFFTDCSEQKSVGLAVDMEITQA